MVAFLSHVMTHTVTSTTGNHLKTGHWKTGLQNMWPEHKLLYEHKFNDNKNQKNLTKFNEVSVISDPSYALDDIENRRF